MERADVVVVGAGVMGAATAWALARRGRRVLVLDRFEPGHGRGSSHGAARVFRLGYADAEYIHLARRALDGWRQAESASGAALLELTGVIDHGPAAAVDPVVRAFDAHDVDHELLDPDAAAARWPGIRFDERVVVHPDGGRLHAQRAVDVLTGLARQRGAHVRHTTAVRGMDADDAAVHLALGDGTSVTADRVVVTAGAWTAPLVGDLAPLPPLQVSAEQPLVLRPRDRAPATWLPFVHRGPHEVYGLGVPGEGVKVAEHYRDEWLDPDDRPFDVDVEARDRVLAYAAAHLPGLDAVALTASRCLYTTTPDKDFVLDRRGRVVVGAGFSGHGFKFAPTVGEVLADLAEGGDQDVARFRAGPRTAVDAMR